MAVPPTLHVMFIFDRYSTVPIGCFAIGLEYMLRTTVSGGGYRAAVVVSRRQSATIAYSLCKVVSGRS